MSFDFSANFAYTGTSQTWTKPVNVANAYFYVNGAGGAGSSVASGGGGAYTLSIFNFLQSDISYNVTINVGGGGKAPPIQTGGLSTGSYTDPSSNNFSNGGDGSTLSQQSSGGGGGMTTVFYNDPSNNKIIKIIAGGGGGGGSVTGANGAPSGNIGTLINNNSASSSIGSSGSGSSSGSLGGQGGNTQLSGNAGLGGLNGGVNGHDYQDTSGAYFYYGGGGGSGGTFAGGGGGAGYGGAAGGKSGGGGGGGSFINSPISLFSLGEGGVGGAPGQNGGNGSVTIYWYEVPPIVPIVPVQMLSLDAQHTARSIYRAPVYKPLLDVSAALPQNIGQPGSSISLTGSPVISTNGNIYFVGNDGYLYAYSSNLELKWYNNFGTFLDFTPALNTNGTIYVCTSINATSPSLPNTQTNQAIYAIIDNVTYGSLKWYYTISTQPYEGNISTSPILDLNNNIYFGTDQGVIYAITDGNNKGVDGWRWPFDVNANESIPDGNAVLDSPVIDFSNNKLCYATSYFGSIGNIYTLDLSSNPITHQMIAPSLRWSKPEQNNINYRYLSIGYINGIEVLYSTTNYDLYAFDLSNGNAMFAPLTTTDNFSSRIAVGNDNRVYFTTSSYLNVVDCSNGVLEWQYPTYSPPSAIGNSPPLIDTSNNVLFGTTDSYLYSINGVNRTFNWRYGLENNISESYISIQTTPVIGNNNNIYAFTGDKIYDFSGNNPPVPPSLPIVPMYMLDKKHTNVTSYYGPSITILPTIKWSTNFVSSNWFVSPSISIAYDGTLYLGSNDGYVYALNSSNGSNKWRVPIQNPITQSYANSPKAIYTTPVISTDGTIYIGTNEGYLFALNPTNGSIKWNYNAGYPLQSSPIIDLSSGTIYFGAGNNVYALKDAGYAAYPKWLSVLFPTGGVINSSPAIGPNGYLYFGSNDGYVYAVDSATGLQACSPFDANLPSDVHPIYTSPSVDLSGNVIIGNGSYMNGVLYYLDASLNLLWTFDYVGGADPDIAKSKFHSPNVGPIYNTVSINGDTIYLSTIGYIYAIYRDTGLRKWYYADSNCYYSSVVVDASGTLFFSSIKVKNDQQYIKNAGILHCMTDNGDGPFNYNINWALQVSTPARLAPPVIGPNQTIYISGTSNKIYAIK